MLRLQLTFLFLIIFFRLSAQYSVEGKIIDASGKQPLAFVNIGIAGSQQTTSSDIDGKFKISSSEPILGIIFTYVGYEPYKYTVGDDKNVLIKMQKKTVDLFEVIVRPGENPANRIIKLASKNRDKNNPDKIRNYICNTYSKTYWDLVYNTDEVKDKKDSLKADSLKSRLRIFSENSHLLMMEAVTERKYISPEKLNEKVIATKVSGFKDPSFTTSATDIQPFGFYKDYFEILGKNYLNPITKGSTAKYYFAIEDTLFQGKDSVYIISYRPVKGKNFDGLEGVLYINTNGYAIQNVIASPYEKGLVDIKIQQQYKFIDNRQWFPEQLNYELHYKKYPTRFIGMKLTGKTYITNVNFDTVLKKKDFDFETVQMETDAAHKDDSYWALHRLDTLDNKEKKTYRVIDSLGRRQHFDRALKVLEALTTLQIPVSVISIDLNKIIAVNDFETIRGGIGLHTNDRLSPWGSVGGYVGYGYKDSITKYGYDLRINLKKNSKDFYIKAMYSKDIDEPGRMKDFYSDYNFTRNELTYRMDYLEQKEVALHFRALGYLTASIAYNQSFRIPRYNYLFLPDKNDQTETSIDFKSTEIRVKGRYAYKERLVQSLGQLLSDGTDYPIVYFGYTKGLKMNSPAAKYDYDKLAIGIEKSFLIKNVGRTKLLLEGGYMKGNVPYPYLFNGNGSYTKGGYLYIENTFQTMGLYEFLSDRYVNLFFSHNFGSLLFKRPKFQPQFMIFSNAGYGSLQNPEQHLNLDFKTMEKGFFESGLLINNVVRVNYYNVVYLGLGGGAFMRYGPYAFAKTDKNLAYKISLVLSF
ncbi:MAG: DUF5686 family protein [Bacteroidia bacterium]